MNLSEYMTYPATIKKASDGKGYAVNIRGLDRAHTCGDTYEEALEMAQALVIDCAIFDAGRREIAKGDLPRDGEVAIHVPADAALKMLLRNAMFEAGVNVAELARRLGLKDAAVRQSLDFRRGTKFETVWCYFQAIERPLQLSA